MAAKRIVVVCTSHDQLGSTGHLTGLWAEELVVPYYMFKEVGAEVVIASIKGGRVPIDPGSFDEGSLTEHVKRFLEDDELMKAVETSIPVADVDDNYDAIFLPGGNGVMFDGPNNLELIALVEKFWVQGKIVSAVCHGPAGLYGAKTANGESIVKGKKVTGFSNSEEKELEKTDIVPFLLEDKLKELGGIYECRPNWAPFAVADGNLITGQNPQSSAKIAEAILAALG